MKRGIQVACAMVMVCACLSVSAAEKGDADKPPKGSSMKAEHLAFSLTSYMYLDGPRLEAQCIIKRSGSGGMDGDGNVWFGHGKVGIVNSIGGRCVSMETGMIRPYFSDDYWTGFADLDEGPGCAFTTLSRHTGLGVPSTTYTIYGSPLKGVDKGYFIISDGRKARKIWMDPEKDDTWWFKTIIGGGKVPLPKVKDGIVGARDVKISIKMVQAMPDGKLIVFAEGGFYDYREEEKEDGTKKTSLVCLFGFDDYRDDCTIPRTKKGQCDMPSMGVLGGDGTFYVGTYFRSGYGGRTPCIWRMVPGGKVEPYAWNVKNGFQDGPAMASGSHCGHHFWAQMHNYAFIPHDVLLITAHDEANLRRIRNGRVSTLCEDGEWREMTDHKKRRFSSWFWCGSSPGPGGTATGENFLLKKIPPFIVTGIDYAKETVGPLMDTPIPDWPPKEDDVVDGGRAKKGSK